MPRPVLLPVLMAALAAMGTLMLGMGQREPFLPVLVFLAAILSVWLTDVTGWFRLNRIVAGVLAIAASAVTFLEAIPLASILSILPIARLLVYLQIILLFQTKDGRIYGQLLVVSLLQVLVAAVFSQGALFGLSMVLYLFLAIAVLTLLYLFREAERFAALAHHGTEAFVGQIARPAAPRGEGRELTRRIVVMGLGTLGLTAVAFFALPRLGRPAWRSPLGSPRRMVGYSGRVELGSLGSVIQSPEEVARVQLLDPDGQPLRIDDPIYLHGTVLTEYRDRAWQSPGRDFRLDIPRPVTWPPDRRIVRQRITAEPADVPELFHVRPFGVVQEDPRLGFERRRERLLRSEADMAERFAYELDTAAFPWNRQESLVPAVWWPDEAQLLQVPRKAVPSLVELAEQWTAAPGLPSDRRLDRAKYLEGRLRSSGQFTYSLHAKRQDYQIDPIEDFVVNEPQGHCEYFATVLALMLRSVGIPSRVVVGYCTDEFNPLGGFYQVRQLHAHTWVEVYLRREQLPGDLAGDPAWRRGGWLRLDATPASHEATSAAGGGLLAPIGRGLGWLEFAWNNYVMEMDRSRQRKAIYEPVLRAFRETYRDLADPAWWKRLGQSILHWLDPRNWNVSQWFSWRGGLVTVVVGLALAVLYRAGRLLHRAGKKWLERRRAKRGVSRGAQVEFYRRFVWLLGRAGLARRPGETPRQFARAAGQFLASRGAERELTGLPGLVVEAYYHVRFGQRPLDNPRRLAVEQAIERIEAACGARYRGGQPS